MKGSQTSNPTRREFLKTMGFVSIGFPLFGNFVVNGGLEDKDLPGSLRGYSKINAWLEVLEDNRVRIFTGKMELGQGIQTAIMQVAAEELSMDMALVEIVMADTERTPNEGYTAGSRSVETSAIAVRYAAAAAREKVLEMAGQAFNQKSESLYLYNGVVYSKSDKKISLYELLKGRQIEDEVTMPVKLKEKEKYQIVGKPIPRRDIEKMMRGEEVYVQDLRFPEMVHARVIRPGGYTSRLQSYNKQKADALPGVVKIVENGDFLAVVAGEEYQAIQARDIIKKDIKWSESKPLPAESNLKTYLKSLSADSSNDKLTGQVSFNKEDANRYHKASYFKPYIMHAANGPSCAIALYENNKLQIWSHSQGVYQLRESLSNLVKMPVEDIHIKGVAGSGCYGHNGADDVAAEAAIIALEYPGRHVRLQWMRDDEHGWEPYGSAMIMELEAELNDAGAIKSWKYDLWSDGHSTRPGGRPENLLPARYMKTALQPPVSGFRGGAIRNAEPYYNIPNQSLNSHLFQGPLRISALRGLGAYANIFAIESFMDELAEKAGKDPLAFRIDHSGDQRAIDCISKLREMTAKVDTAKNEGMGFAFSRYKNSAAYCAVAALVAISSKKVRVKKMWAVVDAGEIINLDGIKNQIEGGMVQSASWTVMEEVRFDANHVTSLDWATYPIFRYRETPDTEVEVINRPEDPPLGAGEAAQGPAAAAIANAMYKAGGERARDLPLNNSLNEG